MSFSFPSSRLGTPLFPPKLRLGTMPDRCRLSEFDGEGNNIRDSLLNLALLPWIPYDGPMSDSANVVITQKSSSPLEPKPESRHLVFCLSIDMFRYTETGLQFTTSQLDGFNRKFIEQLSPYLEKFDLPKVLTKFQGDGWLLMTDEPEQGLALCCLSTVLSKVFQKKCMRAPA